MVPKRTAVQVLEFHSAQHRGESYLILSLRSDTPEHFLSGPLPNLVVTRTRDRPRPWSDFVMQETAQRYHRRSRRVNLGQPVRLIPSLPRGEFFEETGTTSNVSREGFYFLTKREHYQEGMRLLVTLPYHSPPDRSDCDYLGQVVRVERLDEGQRGVAVQLLSSAGGPQ